MTAAKAFLLAETVDFDVVGIHLEAGAVDVVTLPWQEPYRAEAVWVRIGVPVQAGGLDEFYAALRIGPQLLARVDWESVGFGAIELPEIETGSLLAGGIVSAVPAGIQLAPTSPQEWKKAVLGKARATKHEVADWAIGRGAPADWAAGAYCALAIASSASKLNREGIELARLPLGRHERVRLHAVRS